MHRGTTHRRRRRPASCPVPTTTRLRPSRLHAATAKSSLLYGAKAETADPVGVWFCSTETRLVPLRLLAAAMSGLPSPFRSATTRPSGPSATAYVCWVEKEAAGVVAAIIAYNYPNQLALAKLAPALAAGCTVVLKAAPDTPLITLALGELIANHTDIPAGVVNVLSGADPQVGAALTTSPDVDMVTFTGSTPTGRRIMAAASETLKRVFLELGGKSAAIVLDDADFNTAAMFSAFSMVTHAGQGCALTSRLLVPRKHHDEIVELIKNNFGLVRYGDPSEPKTYMGPLISAKQRDKVDGMVKRAVEAGATLVTGGEKVDPGYFYTPTLLTDVDPDSEIAQEEVFGPVLVVIAYEDDDDAVRIANNSIYGLSGAVFGGQVRALAVARRIRTGTFSINGGNYFSPDSPFGGFKQSGIGREMGSAGLEEFLESKTFAEVVSGAGS